MFACHDGDKIVLQLNCRTFLYICQLISAICLHLLADFSYWFTFVSCLFTISAVCLQFDMLSFNRCTFKPFLARKFKYFNTRKNIFLAWKFKFFKQWKFRIYSCTQIRNFSVHSQKDRFINGYTSAFYSDALKGRFWIVEMPEIRFKTFVSLFFIAKQK